MKKKICSISFFLSVLLLPLLSFASAYEDSLWSVYNKKGQVSARVDILLRLSELYDLANRTDERDSIFQLATRSMDVQVRDTLLLRVYNWYFDKGEEYFNERTPGYLADLRDLTNRHKDPLWKFAIAYAEGNYALSQFRTEEALKFAKDAYYLASQTADPKLKVRAMLLWGNCLQWSNQKVDAFTKLIDALYLSRKIDNEQLTFLSYQKLAGFYYLIDDQKRAKEYTKEQYKILLSETPVDSTSLVKLDIAYAGYLFDNNERMNAEELTGHILDYTNRHGYLKLKQKIFATYRTFLFNNGYFADLADLYTTKYPGELDKLAVSNPVLYYRIRAVISEVNGRTDSAEHFYVAAENVINKDGNSAFISNFYKRYGEFLARTNRIGEAEQKLKTAYEYALAAQYIPYLTEITHELDSLTFLQGKTVEAYKYSKLNQQYNRRAELAHQEEELLKLEVDNEAREKELVAQREAEAIERRHNLQYMGLSILIVLSFIALAALGSFKVHRFVVKALGFFSFIFLFEFIIMFADHEIHHFTHGEPWKFMAFKIVLIGILLPLHHWLEHKVVHYLVSHKIVDPKRISIKGWLRKIKNGLKPKSSEVQGNVAVEIADEAALGKIRVREQPAEEKQEIEKQ